METPPPRELSKDEFLACFDPPMVNVMGVEEAVVDIWSYVDQLDLDSLGLPSLTDVHYVYRDASNRYDQVLVGTGRFNALLVIVVDLTNRSVFGHRVLDLGAEYEVTGGHLRDLP